MSTNSTVADTQEHPNQTPTGGLLHQAHVLPPPITTVRDLARQGAWFDGDRRMRGTREPDDVKHDNTRRAGFGAHALAQTAIRTGVWSPKDRTNRLSAGPAPATVLKDLLTYLHHTADSLGLDYEEIDVQARRDYLGHLRKD
jgi:hypothetical protein